MVGSVWYDDDDDWYGKRIVSRTPTSTHSFNTSGSVAVVPDKVEEKDDEAPPPVATNIGVCGNAVDDRGSLG